VQYHLPEKKPSFLKIYDFWIKMHPVPKVAGK